MSYIQNPKKRKNPKSNDSSKKEDSSSNKKVDEKSKPEDDNEMDKDQEEEECTMCDKDNDDAPIVCIDCYLKEQKKKNKEIKISFNQKRIVDAVMDTIRAESYYGFGDQIEDTADGYESLLDDIIVAVMGASNNIL